MRGVCVLAFLAAIAPAFAEEAPPEVPAPTAQPPAQPQQPAPKPQKAPKAAAPEEVVSKAWMEEFLSRVHDDIREALTQMLESVKASGKPEEVRAVLKYRVETETRFALAIVLARAGKSDEAAVELRRLLGEKDGEAAPVQAPPKGAEARPLEGRYRVDGNGYFAMRVAHGPEDKGVKLEIVTFTREAVFGIEGGALVVRGIDEPGEKSFPIEPGVQVPEGTERLVIQRDGTVVALMHDGRKEIVGQVQLAVFREPRTLIPVELVPGQGYKAFIGSDTDDEPVFHTPGPGSPGGFVVPSGE